MKPEPVWGREGSECNAWPLEAFGGEEKLMVKAGSEQMRRKLASMTNPMILGISSCLLGPNIYSIILFLN